MGLGFGIAPLSAALVVGAAPVEFEVRGPDPLILGDVEAVEVRFSAPETQEVAGRPLRVSVNVGAFGPIEKLGPGVYRSTYRLPETAFPQVALVAVWRETGPEADVRFFRIPLHGRTEVPVRARPGALVTVTVADRAFGPVSAPRGRVRVPIVVPPGVEEVTVTSVVGRRRSQARVAAGVPPYNRMTLALTPYKVPSDGASSAVLHAYVDRVPPIDPRRVRLTAPRGRIAFSGAAGPVVRFRYTPERDPAGGRVEISGRVLRDPASRATVELELGRPAAERVVLQPSATAWVADGTRSFTVDALVTDRLGLGVEGLEVTAQADPARVEAVEPEGRGRYRVVLAPLARYPDTGAVALRVTAPREAGAPLVERTRLPVEPPPWPAEIAIEPRLVPAGDRRGYVAWSAFDAAGAPYTDGGFDVRVEAQPVASVATATAGRYRSAVEVGPGRRRVRVRVVHARGEVRAVREVRIPRDAALFEVGARVGPLISDGLHFLGGIELGLRLPPLRRRVAIRARASYFRRDAQFTAAFPDGSEGAVDARLQTVPFALGATVDLVRWRGWTGYAGAFGLLALGFETVDPRFTGATERSTRVFGGGEGVLGVAWQGVFAELGGGILRVDEADLQAPDVLWTATLGYRLGLF